MSRQAHAAGPPSSVQRGSASRERPARADLETGTWKKKWKDKLPVALVYPNVYRLGMSNLGFQLVYDLLNQLEDVVCERVFLPDSPGPPRSEESNRPLTDFPVIFFSISFEHDFLNLVTVLQTAGIEPLATVRQQTRPANGIQPLLIGGGVATFINPEPLAAFMDLLVIGEAEPVLARLLALIQEDPTPFDRQALLWNLAASIPGCYAPRFYEMAYDERGRVTSIRTQAGLPARVRKTTQARAEIAGYSRLMTPEAEFADLFLVELGRGCSRGCRFCAAGFVYRPPRLWGGDPVLQALAQRPEHIRRVGLLGMEMTPAADLERIGNLLLDSSCSLSFSSLRADALGLTLLELLAKSGLKSVAIAPDGGSERLRRVINKGISEEDIFVAAEALVRAGVYHLKLYFMIGLPTETMADIDELLGLVLKVREKIFAVGRARGRLTNITLSVNCFVPKAWTPFQFCGFTPVPVLKGRLQYIRKKLARQPNIRVNADNPVNAFYQAVLARGSRRVGEVLARLPGERGWQHFFRQQGVEPEDYGGREREENEIFPWEVIDHGLDRHYLWQEYQRALAEKITPRCDVAKCRRCGVCNGPASGSGTHLIF